MTKQESFLSTIFSQSKKGKVFLTFSILLSVLGTLFSVVPYLSVYFIAKEFLIPNTTNNAVLWSVIAGLSIVGNMAFSLLGSLGCHKVAFKVLFDFRIRVMEHIGKLSISFFTKNTSGSIQKTMDENIEKIEGFIAHMLPDLVSSFILLIVLIFGIGYLNIFLSLTVILSIVIAFTFQLLVFGNKRAKKLWSHITVTAQKETGAFSEFVRGIAEVKLFGQKKKTLTILSHLIDEHLELEDKSYRIASLPMSLYKSIILSLLSFVLPVSVIILSANPSDANILAVLMTLILAPSIYDPLMLGVSYATQMGMLQAGMTQIQTILDTPLIPDIAQSQTLTDYSVSFENVSFTYPPSTDLKGKNALEKISFTANQGETIALVGESGSGKSTIANLLLRFWDVDSGLISIGETNINDLKLSALNNSIATVLQDTYLFTDTVSANISMALPSSQEDVIRAAKAARCHDFIIKLPHGYDTVIGPGGTKLSGGEAQRLSIARAILKASPIILLDEALAYADAENENLIQNAIKTMVKHKTVIVIAHRLKSIQTADKICVLKNGQLIESGKHDVLMSLNGEYKELWDLQHKIDTWSIERGRN